ncbi:winged helix-turn-helix domain-containing protein [Acetobacter persici]|uniref:LysR family transcriptional regulator n=1 Tax=Acetobacter persici TaxID=1076596 RepID=A0A6V8I965_9PROT|nr:winged helix-turn-helix domain-containing protein [Acetobacter persici]OUI91335.1 transcriptional regulator [Acetobacter persici]GFE94120.1 LysR family transcriptional regulator [Acetobacter persici]
MTERLRLTLRVDADKKPALGHGKIRLLEQLAETGSISAAGRAMGMSYRRTWLLVDSLNQMFREPLVVTRPGGGGGAFLTAEGEAVVRCYRDIEKQAAQVAEAHLAELEKLLTPQAVECP